MKTTTITSASRSEFELTETPIPGCFEVLPLTHRDSRGSFVKIFHLEQFRELGLETSWPEEFYSRSVEGVLRGLHFITPPNHQYKIVTCIQGAVMDAIVDLRLGSPTFGKHFALELSAKRANMIFLDKGVAHGFYVPSGEAILHYRVSTLYSASHDKGIRWNSAGIPWPTESPLVSARDAALPTFQEFISPFRFKEVPA